MRMVLEAPHAAGSYRWYYADFTDGETSAVFIFMLGPPFSPRFASANPEAALPRHHVAVNLAVYRNGRRLAWALSEYASAKLDAAGTHLQIGQSHIRVCDNAITIEVNERMAPFGARCEARLELERLGPAGTAIELVPGLPHRWHPIAPYARAALHLGAESFEGRAYLDSNDGDEPLGIRLGGWTWARFHDACGTRVIYAPEGGPAFLVDTGPQHCLRFPAEDFAGSRTRSLWGLEVPRVLELGEARIDATLLESSPFYARLEGASKDVHALAEVADFRRFRSPWIRWMAHFRSRRGEVAA